MSHQEILDCCISKPGAYIDFPFGEDVTVIKVKTPSQNSGRIFAQLFFQKGEPKATFICDAMTDEFYCILYPDQIVMGSHCPAVQQPYFYTINLDDAVPDEEFPCMIDHSYSTVVAKLPKYAQRELIRKSE